MEITKILQHDNLCSYYDSGEFQYGEHPLAYIVTEYIRGENLNNHIARMKELSIQELKAQIEASEKAYRELKVAHAISPSDNPAKITPDRRRIAPPPRPPAPSGP